VSKVSRYTWPESKAERLAVIEANLRVEIPERRWGRPPKVQKEELEASSEEIESAEEA
jgi:hypothetical protein